MATVTNRPKTVYKKLCYRYALSVEILLTAAQL